jgi:hypothetical protein
MVLLIGHRHEGRAFAQCWATSSALITNSIVLGASHE